MAVATLAASLLLTCCRVFTPTQRLLVAATAFVPIALLGYALAACLCWAVRRLGGRGRRPVSAVALTVSLLGVAFHAGLLLPSYAGSHASGRPDLTVLTSNLRFGLGDTAKLARVARAHQADVVVLEEVTPEAVVELSDLREALPYTAGEPGAGASGTMVFSRYPLSEVTSVPVSKGTWRMRVAAPEPFQLLAVHTAQPFAQADAWQSDHETIADVVRQLQADRGGLVVAGDLNATLDHRPMRTLLGLGLADAARQANAGWQPTWPADDNPDHALPFGLRVMALDHILVNRQFSAISTSTYAVPNSDHRALLARLAVSSGPRRTLDEQ